MPPPAVRRVDERVYGSNKPELHWQRVSFRGGVGRPPVQWSASGIVSESQHHIIPKIVCASGQAELSCRFEYEPLDLGYSTDILNKCLPETPTRGVLSVILRSLLSFVCVSPIIV